MLCWGWEMTSVWLLFLPSDTSARLEGLYSWGGSVFTLSYQPVSGRTEPDALSTLSSSEPEEEQASIPSLSLNCFSAWAKWEIKRLVTEAQCVNPDPGTGPAGWLYIPDPVCPQVLQWPHSSKFTCHPGINPIFHFLKERFGWPSMTQDTCSFVSACTTCARSKSDHHAGHLWLSPIPHRSWSHISVDLITGLTIVDLFSKSVHYIPLAKLPSTNEITDLLVQDVFRLHDIPSDIVSDCDPQSSQVWKAFCQSLGAVSGVPVLPLVTTQNLKTSLSAWTRTWRQHYAV